MVEFLRWVWEQFERYILPFTIIHIYERGVKLTFGKNPIPTKCGLVFKVPFMHEVYTETVTPNTLQAKCVHVTTIDGKTVLVSPAIEYIIEDVVKWIVETNDAITNLHDILRYETADHITELTWDECKKKSTCTDIRRELNKKAFEMGARIIRVMFTDISQSRVIITSI